MQQRHTDQVLEIILKDRKAVTACHTGTRSIGEIPCARFGRDRYVSRLPRNRAVYSAWRRRRNGSWQPDHARADRRRHGRSGPPPRVPASEGRTSDRRVRRRPVAARECPDDERNRPMPTGGPAVPIGGAPPTTTSATCWPATTSTRSSSARATAGTPSPP